MKRSSSSKTAKQRKAEPGRQPGKAAAGKSKSARKPAKKKAAKKSPQKAAKSVRKPVLPDILKEGDRPAATRPGGPGQRFAPTPGLTHKAPPHPKERKLPEAYGTGRLYLAARDPHWLYATWDLTRSQQDHYNGLSRDRHLVLRIHKETTEDSPYSEIHLPPASRNWFAHVGQGHTRFIASLGYYQADGTWITLSQSEPVLTPADQVSADTTFRLETLPPGLDVAEVCQWIKESAPRDRPLLDALDQLREAGHTQLPPRQQVRAGTWTPEQEAALSRLLSMDDVHRFWIGSHEITELVRRHLAGAAASQALAPTSPGVGDSAGVSSLSRPSGAPSDRPRGFWFNLHAELVIYGATEPDATVTFDGKPIRLRRDGTFSFRFALPDGRFPLSVEATSASGDDSRSAHLDFQRVTHYRGKVDPHPQDPSLKPPVARHVA